MSNKGALTLLADYGGDSSDEEVPGPRVSCKRQYKNEDENDQNKRHKRLPAPKFILDDPEAITDNPSLHEGRKRSFPHERGNWATYVYITYDKNEGLEKLQTRISEVASLKKIPLKYFDNFHLSLTKTVIVRHHWIDSLINTIKEHLSYFTKFIIMVDCLEIYCNEEKSRTFIGLKMKTGYDTLLKMVNSLDEALAEFKLPKFYENPSFHISIAWCLGDQSEELKAILPLLNQELNELINEYSQENWYIYVEKLICKSGNKMFQFQLR